MYSVLIVDDEALIIESLKGKINWASHGAVFAGSCANGRQALAFIQKNLPDIVILDMKMPVMDGASLIEEVLRLNIRCQMIICSAYTDFEYTRGALKSKAVDYLVKPVTIRALNEAVGNAVRCVSQERLAEYDRQLAVARLNLRDSPLDSLRQKPDAREPQGAIALILTEFLGRRLDSGTEPIEKSGMEELIKRLRALNPADGFAHVDFFYGYGRPCELAAIVTYAGADLEKQLSGLAAYAETLRRALREEGFTALTARRGVCQRADEIPEEYRRLKEVILRASLKGDEVVSVIPCGPDETAPPLLESERGELVVFVRKRNSKALRAWALKLFERLDGIPSFSIMDLERTLRAVLDAAFTLLPPPLPEGDVSVFSMLEIWRADILDFNVIADKLSRFLSSLFAEWECGPLDSARQIAYAMKKSIDEGYAGLISLQGFSDIYHRGREYLSKIFKDEFQINFLTYLNETRLRHARALICETALSFADIAMLVGYDDPKYFLKIFKKTFGCTPGEYRGKTEIHPGEDRQSWIDMP